MSIKMEYKWTILKVRVAAEEKGLRDVVKQVEFDIKGVQLGKDEDGMSHRCGETLLLPPDSSSFIPFTALKEETLLEWVKDCIGSRTIYDLQYEMMQEVESINDPEYIEMELPWIARDEVVYFKGKRLGSTEN